ncbi:hypothetical protein BDV97DRAFT_341045 [Delphinella strobiligena]|nr:hypothetical protein BDV97DRAFT_341045 [Delphinella strobiligena]
MRHYAFSKGFAIGPRCALLILHGTTCHEHGLVAGTFDGRLIHRGGCHFRWPFGGPTSE